MVEKEERKQKERRDHKSNSSCGMSSNSIVVAQRSSLFHSIAGVLPHVPGRPTNYLFSQMPKAFRYVRRRKNLPKNKKIQKKHFLTRKKNVDCVCVSVCVCDQENNKQQKSVVCVCVSVSFLFRRLSCLVLYNSSLASRFFCLSLSFGQSVLKKHV